ncbi:MAG: DUF4340 domain-containing protein [Candidatus Zixiibacteriota bacterium]
MKKSLMTLGGIAVVLILVYVVMSRSEQAALAPHEASNFVGVDSGAVNKIVITRMGEEAQLERSGEGWNVLDAGNLKRADKMIVDQIANLAHGLTVGDIISSNSEKQMLFQVDTLLGRKVSFYHDDQPLGTLIVGKAGSDMRSTYVRKPESADVYLAPMPLTRLLDRPARGFRDKIISPLDTARINMVEIASKDFHYAVVRVDSIWTVKVGNDPAFVADHAKARQLLTLVGNLRVADFVADAVRDTIDMAAATDLITVYLNDGTTVGLTLKAKGEPSKDYYLRFSTDNDLFSVFEGTHKGLIKKPEEYMQGGA